MNMKKKDLDFENIALVLAGKEGGKGFLNALRSVGWIELRVDYYLRQFPKGDTVAWAREIRKVVRGNIIATVRHQKEQEKKEFAINENVRLQLYQKLLPYVDYVDVELRSRLASEVVHLAHRDGKKVICSYHDFSKTPSPDRCKSLLRRAQGLGADIFKIATRVRSSYDFAVLLTFLAQKDKDAGVIVIPMGTRVLERIVPLYLGSLFTYVFWTVCTASGQPSFKEIEKTLDKIKYAG